VFYGVVGLFLGGMMFVNWWFAMFSDSGYGKGCRSMLWGDFSLGRNTVAVIEPAVGGFMLFGGAAMLVGVAGFGNDSVLMSFFAPAALLSLLVAALGLIPFPLPAPMYPEWQLEKRRRRAARSGAGSAEEVWRRAGYPTGDPDVPEGFEEEVSPYQTPRRYSGRHKRRRRWLPWS
jgi:hypothetical protein